MAKNVFRYMEFNNKLTDKVAIKPPPSNQPEVVEEIAAEEEYTGPTADQLRREAEEFKEQWEGQKALMLQEAELRAEEVVKQAQAAAFEILKKQKDDCAKLKIDAEKEAQDLMDQARKDAAKYEAQVKSELSGLEEQARKKGYDTGYAEGYDTGRAEVTRLVERIHTIIQRIIEKRSEIIEGTETQIVNLVLMIAKKVIKVISENQRNVVINNVLQALRKLKTRGDVVVRVNLEDLKVTSEHTKEFLKLVENVKSINVLEDSTVDQGGCLIETDFGEIDGRISSQLNEIEEKILQLMPIRSNVTGAAETKPPVV